LQCREPEPSRKVATSFERFSRRRQCCHSRCAAFSVMPARAGFGARPMTDGDLDANPRPKPL